MRQAMADFQETSGEEQNPSCFMFYSGGATCKTCRMNQRCRAILITHGFDLLAAAIQAMAADLEEGDYQDSDRVKEIVEQLLDPPKGSGGTPDPLLALLHQETGAGNVDLGDL